MLQLHKILIGLVLVGMIATGFVLFLNEGVQSYNSSTYDNSSLQSFNMLDNLSEDIDQFNEKEEGIATEDSILDILGSFFTNMYQSAKVFKSSVDVMDNMVDSSLETVPTGTYGSVLKTGLGLIAMIAIFVGIFLAFVTKSERT